MRCAVPIIMLLILAACSARPPLNPFVEEKTVWPEPPEAKRIAYLGAFSNATDLGIRESAWKRFLTITAGEHSNEMIRPMAVAASADGKTIFVADPDARCVHRYDINRGRYACLKISRRESLVSPVGLALTENGELYVADSSLGRLYRGSIEDKYLKAFDVSTNLQQPTGLAWDEAHGLLFVTDTGSQSIKAFDRQGNLIKEFGGRGPMPGQFNFPTYLWFDPQDELLVTDSLNFRIQRFNDGGEFLFDFGENGDRPGYLARPKGVATDSFGHIYVIDAIFNALQVFDERGSLLLAIGTRGQAPGEFWLPNGVFIAGDNTIYIADSYNKRIQVFRYVGPDA
jgi:sugar lactone lactonase YvrE